MANFDYSDMTNEEAEKAFTKMSYIALMGRKTKVSPQMLQYSPTPYVPTPEKEDYERGMFPRFFVRKSNDPNAPVMEVSQESYQGPIRVSPFYVGVVVKWQISGSVDEKYSDDGILLERGVINNNVNQIESAYRSKGIKVDIANPLEFYKAD